MTALVWAGVATPAIAQTKPSLIDAVKAGRVAEVRTLLQRGAAVGKVDPDGTTALHWAVQGNDVTLAQLLIKAGANVRVANRYGVTPLALAATNGSAPMVELLLKAGSDPNTANAEGETVLMTAAKTGRADVVRLLAARGANVNAVEQWQQQTALMWAAAENHAGTVAALLELGAKPNLHSKPLDYPVFYRGGMAQTEVYPKGSLTALMYAAREGAIDAVRVLADRRAGLDLQAGDGTTALTLAILSAHYDTAILLLEKGANPNVLDEGGMGPLYATVDMHTLAIGGRDLAPRLLDKANAVDVVEALLAHGADPNAQLTRPVTGRHRNWYGDPLLGRGATPLARAARSNDVAIVRRLLAAGANPDLAVLNGTTPLMFAARGDHTMGFYGTVNGDDATTIDIIKLLVEHGADVTAFNTDGETAMHLAAARYAPSVIAVLAEHGAVPSLAQKNRRGRTPLEMAMRPPEPVVGRGGGPGRRDTKQQEPAVALLRGLMEKNGIPVAAVAAPREAR